MLRITRIPRILRIPAVSSYRDRSSVAMESSLEKVKAFEALPGPRGLPWLGTLLNYKLGPHGPEQYHEALLSLYRKYGPVFRQTLAGRTMVHVFDPELSKLVLAKDGSLPVVSPLAESEVLYRKMRKHALGPGNTNGEEWYRFRRNINPTMLRPAAVVGHLGAVNHVTDGLVHRLRGRQEGRVEDTMRELNRWTLETSAKIAFDVDLGSFDASPGSVPERILDAKKVAFNILLPLNFGIHWYKYMPWLSSKWKKMCKAEDEFYGAVEVLLGDALARLSSMDESEAQLKLPFLTSILARKAISYEEVALAVVSLIGDGLNAIPPALFGQLYCLANNPEKQEMLYQEVCDLAPDPSQPITADVINRASYLKACVKEGFRMFTNGSEVARIAKTDMVIHGYHIPEGTSLELNHPLLLRDSQYFDEPDTYLPERWLRRGAVRREDSHPFLLTPFGHGARMCPGRRMSEQQFFVALMKLVRSFKMSWPHAEPPSYRYCLLLVPDAPGCIGFETR